MKLSEIVEKLGDAASNNSLAVLNPEITGVAPVDAAAPNTLSFIEGAKFARQVGGTAIAQAQINVKLNQIENLQFQVGKVEKLLPQLEVMPDIVLLDPPRQGCDRAVLSTLLEMKPQRIVYVSCKPSTLARDLQILCGDGGYELSRVQPADFFPQTSHVECAAFLNIA